MLCVALNSLSMLADSMQQSAALLSAVQHLFAAYVAEIHQLATKKGYRSQTEPVPCRKLHMPIR